MLGSRPCMTKPIAQRLFLGLASWRKPSRLGLFVLALLCCFGLGLSSGRAERRVAMVIGNASYQNAPSLRTPTTDAAEVSKLLRTLDFSVIELTNVDKVGMERALRQFSSEMNGADVALFYYSGHGVQVGDLNYLVPISAKIDGARSLALDTIALQDVNSAMQEAGVRVQLLFLDACRDNPFAAAFVSAHSGAPPGLCSRQNDRRLPRRVFDFARAGGARRSRGCQSVYPWLLAICRRAGSRHPPSSAPRPILRGGRDGQSAGAVGQFFAARRLLSGPGAGAAPVPETPQCRACQRRDRPISAPRRANFNRKGARSPSRSIKGRRMDASRSIPAKFRTAKSCRRRTLRASHTKARFRRRPTRSASR